MPKARAQLKINVQPAVKGGGAPSSGAAAVDIAPPAPPSIEAPDNLSLATSIGSSTAAPTAIISATWDAPPGVMPQGYVVQASTGSGFAAATTITLNTIVRSVAIENLRPGTVYYVRVAARVQGWQGAWSSMSPLVLNQNYITSATDTVAASVPSGQAAAWVGTGDLLITWTNPTEANFKDVQIVVRASAGSTIYRTFYSAAEHWLYTFAMNDADTSHAPDNALYIELKSRTFSNVLSAAVNTGLVTKAAPATPTSLTQSWTGDTGTAGPDLTIAWAHANDAARWTLTLDGVARNVVATRYTYTLDANRAEHSGTPDPAVSYSLVAVDAFGTVSTAVSGTATNAAPAAPASASITGFFSTFAISITAPPPADFSHYLVRIIQTSPSASDVTFTSTATLITRTIGTAATYQAGVKVVDLFGQASAETLSSTAALDALAIADLRSRIVYSDSEATSASTLKAALSDDVKGSGGVSYSSNASWVRWIDADWLLNEHSKTMTLSMTPASGTTNWYVRLSKDGSTWSYFSGPVVATGTTGLNTTLTAVANAAAAQAAAVSAATLGGPTTSRIDLPTLQDVRYSEVWLRNTAANTRVDEFYPRRLTQSDDGEFESIKTINLAASSVTADRMSVAQLSAITADMGSITAGTITGATIRSAASGARWEGNTTHLFGTDGTTTQWEVLNSTGKFTAGGGNIILDATGMTINSSTGTLDALRFHNASDSGNIGNIWALRSSSGASFDDFRIERRRRDGTNLSEIILTDALISLYPSASLGGADFGSTLATIYSGLNVGTPSTNAATGEIYASQSIVTESVLKSTITDTGTNNLLSGLTLQHLTSGTPTVGFGGVINFQGHSSNNTLRTQAQIYGDWLVATDGSQQGRLRGLASDSVGPRTGITISANGSAVVVGLFGSTGVTRPAITGVRTGTLAQLQTVVANLLTALANEGLITDSTT